MSDPDLRLVRRARRGDGQALAALYERYRARLYGFLVRSAGEPALAEDLYQEVWMKVMGALGGFETERGTFRAWLFRIAANAAVDERRRRALRRGPELDALLPSEEGRVVDLVPSGDPGPERRGVAGDELRGLDRALALLSDQQRDAVLLRHQQGLTYPELARALSVPEGTAKSLVHRGVLTLRRALGGRIDD
jgi:RNA polymerase sigma-70 factor (ECF subfamily)